MPTNRQMEAADAIEAARVKAKLIREGILDPLVGKAISRRAPKVSTRAWGDLDGGGRKAPDFNVPAARPVRLRTATGVTSFHFSHSAVSKVTFETCQDGLRNQPGAARSHGRYIERDCAVATVDAGFRMAPDQQPEPTLDQSANTTFNLDVGQDETGQHPSRQQENGHEQPQDIRSPEAETSRAMVEQFALYEPDAGGSDRERPFEDAESDAHLQLLSSRDLVCDGWGAEHFLLGTADVSLETGEGSDRLRCPPTGDRGNGKNAVDPDWVSPLAEQDRYLIRPSALAKQPDATRALLTNIDYDDRERANFWTTVERHERKPSPDKMAFRACDNPEFWDAVLLQEDCPPEILAKLLGPDRNSSEAIKISSGKQVRAWLRQQAGWVEPQADRKRSSTEPKLPPLAKFVDGRGGRVQYRIAAELPDELTPSQNFDLLADFAKVFEERELPFIAVMHAPDEHNHRKNWHFHIAYHDRPARRIDPNDIEQLALEGHNVAGLKPGMWDFAVEVPVPGRNNRTTFPLRENKVPEVSRDKKWPKTLRVALAKIVNRHLADAGIDRRVSPETYENMGIAADPQEHLGTTQNALETQGVATQTGIENERKQWAAIQAQADARYQAELADAEAACVRAMMRQSSTNGHALELQRRLRDQLQQAARLKRDAFLLEQEMQRAASRARMVRERNLQLLKACDAAPEKANARERAEYGELVHQATQYLAKLDERQTDDRALAARWRATARRCLDSARSIAKQMETPLFVAQPAQAPASPLPPAISKSMPVRAAASDRTRSSWVQPTEPQQADLSSYPPGFSPAEIERRIAEINARDESSRGQTVPPDPPEKASESVQSADKQPKPPLRPQMPPPGWDLGR